MFMMLMMMMMIRISLTLLSLILLRDNSSRHSFNKNTLFIKEKNMKENISHYCLFRQILDDNRIIMVL